MARKCWWKDLRITWTVITAMTAHRHRIQMECKQEVSRRDRKTVACPWSEGCAERCYLDLGALSTGRSMNFEIDRFARPIIIKKFQTFMHNLNIGNSHPTSNYAICSAKKLKLSIIIENFLVWLITLNLCTFSHRYDPITKTCSEFKFGGWVI